MFFKFVLLSTLFSISTLSLFSQFSTKYKDLDRRSVVVKTDDDIIEAQVYEGIEEKKIKQDRTYYWYDHNMIMSSRGGFTGELLHGTFEVQYRSYQIKEKGEFRYGLKHGRWAKWYEDGNPKEFVRYRKGLMFGCYYYFDATGKIIEKGRYNRKGLKTGKVKIYKLDGTFEYHRFKDGKEVIAKSKHIGRVPENAQPEMKVFKRNKKSNKP